MAQEYTVTAEATMPNIHISGSGHNKEKVTWTVPSLPSNAIVINVKFTGIFNCSYTYANTVGFMVNGGDVFSYLFRRYQCNQGKGAYYQI